MADTNEDLRLAEGALPVPNNQRLSSIRLWCEYAVWGLLHYDNQSPWMTLVEMLQISFELRGDGLLPGLRTVDGRLEHETLTFSAPRNGNLRHLLFDDDHLAQIAASPTEDDASMYASWLDKVKKHDKNLNLAYVKDEFEEFSEFARAVELLRAAEIETHTVKRRTSRHLIPLGPSLLFADTDDHGNMDRRFLRRTGELLYLMLNRSRRHREVAHLLDVRLLSSDSPWERLSRRLSGPDDGKPAQSSIGYLPMAEHGSYDRLADDWIDTLSLEAIPIENLLDPLARLSGFNQLIYIVERAADVIGNGRSAPPFVLDFTGRGGSNAMREESSVQYNRHRHMIDEGNEAFIDAFVASKEWQDTVVKPTASKEAFELIGRRFRFRREYHTTPDRYPSPDLQIDELRTEAGSRSGHTISSFFVSCARKIGLLSSRQGAGTWYAPTDAFVEALVLANVTVPLEFDDFLARLHRRYHVVVGRDAAIETFGQSPLPLQVLKENEEHLEDRLRILGFLDRKSDACAFVVNPFHTIRISSPKAAVHVGP